MSGSFDSKHNAQRKKTEFICLWPHNSVDIFLKIHQQPDVNIRRKQPD